MTAVLITGADEILKVLDGLDGKDRQNTERRAVRAAAKPFQASLKSAAASADVPRSFQKVPAAKISTHGGASGRAVVAKVRPSSPLFNIFQPGAGAPQIAPKAPPRQFGQVGSGSWDPAGRKRPDTFAAHGPVRHPGLAARDILGPAFAEAEAAAMQAFEAVIFAKSASAAGGPL
jgi:hypothetical protein